MKSPKSCNYSTFVATLLAAAMALASPVSMCAQTPPTTTVPAKKPAPVPVKPVVKPKAAATPAQPASVSTQPTPPSQTSATRSASSTTAAAGTGTLTWGTVVYSPAG